MSKHLVVCGLPGSGKSTLLGLIGGLGPGATVHYYQELVKGQAGEMMMVQADMDRVYGLVQRGDRSGLAEYFGRLIERLARGGAEVAAIPAITPHICIRELKEISALPLVNIMDEVNAEIRERGFKRVALFGTRFVMQTRMFGMLEVEAMVPDQVEEVHDTYMKIVRGGSEGADVLTGIARGLAVDAVLLAGTELSLIFDEATTRFPSLDCAKAHIRGILRRLA